MIGRLMEIPGFAFGNALIRITFDMEFPFLITHIRLVNRF
jgi:hypothetical protein